MAIATFGAGCFWGVEHAFRQVEGVRATRVGYLGGTAANPTYEQVCSGRTGHAEVVEVEYDEDAIDFRQLLEVFWAVHDPTQLNRQGPDFGEQYRSAIFYHTPEQRQIADEAKRELQASGRFPNAIVTAIEPAGTFYAAEEYHQQYHAKHGRAERAASLKV